MSWEWGEDIKREEIAYFSIDWRISTKNIRNLENYKGRDQWT